MANKYEAFSKAAQDANRKLRMCERKKPFDNEYDAAATGQKVYLCPYCDKYHRSGQFAKLVNTLKKRNKKHDNENKSDPRP